MLDLIEHLYDSVLADDALDRFLSELGLRLGARTACLIMDIHSGTDDHVFMLHGGDRESVERYRNVMYASDPFVNLPPNEVVLIEELVDMDQWQTTEFYQYCIEPSGLYHFLGMDMPVDDSTLMRLRVGRAKEDGNFTENERDICRLLNPHILKAYRIKKEIGYSSKEIDIYRDTFDKLSVGVMVLSPSWEVLSSSPKADAMLEGNDQVSLRNGRLKFLNATERQRFKEACDETVRISKSGETQVARAVGVKSRRRDGRLTLTIKPNVPAVGKMTSKSPPKLMVFVNDHEASMDANVGVLMDVFDLTKAESRLSLLLVNGHTLNEAAEILSIKPNTAKAHLRAIFSKMHVGRQSQMVAEIARGIANLVS